MPLKTDMWCDIYDTPRDVQEVKVTITPKEAYGMADEQLKAQEWTAFLSRRAYRRLVKFIERGLAPPKGRQEE